MKKYDEIDVNFKVPTKIQKDDIKFYSVLNKPFGLYGAFYVDGKFRRIPESVAKATNEGVWGHHTSMAGVRVRFKTNSPYIAIFAKMPAIGRMPHFALTGSSGFDLYRNKDGDEYLKTFVPPYDFTDGYESVIDLEDKGMYEYTINFPLYSDVSEFYVGLSENAKIEEPAPYKDIKPIVYYGSSITQGGCASRPGRAYSNIITRRLNVDHINLGFSGSARGEDAIAEYISGLDMSVFVYDYDHNAPTVEYLKGTHEKMFKTIRAKNPNLSIVMLSRPRYRLNDEHKARIEVIKTTYQNAVDSGDKNVYFIDGPTLMQYAKNEGTADDVHPNDLGFVSMAQVIGDLLEKLI
ncbi:MAG: SGNH/GDSL hydrolase family protein [Clostridia bacterium]|nr:SGNH/GDSL hydrolase family protein [Clostridia bacterium]